MSTKDKMIEVSEGWLIDIKAALQDPINKNGLRYECIQYLKAKLSADLLAHCCPEWDGAFISPNDAEWDACICDIKRSNPVPAIEVK